PEHSHASRRFVARGLLGIKPGWTRITLPPYAADDEIDFILTAIELVADRGAAFLPLYELDWRDGVWRHRSFTPRRAKLALEEPAPARPAPAGHAVARARGPAP